MTDFKFNQVMAAITAFFSICFVLAGASKANWSILFFAALCAMICAWYLAKNNKAKV